MRDLFFNALVWAVVILLATALFAIPCAATIVFGIGWGVVAAGLLLIPVVYVAGQAGMGGGPILIIGAAADVFGLLAGIVCLAARWLLATV